MPQWLGSKNGTISAYGIDPVEMVIDQALLPGGRSTSGYGEPVWLLTGKQVRGLSGLAGYVPGLGAIDPYADPIVKQMLDQADAFHAAGQHGDAAYLEEQAAKRVTALLGAGSQASVSEAAPRVIDATGTPLVVQKQWFQQVPWWGWALAGALGLKAVL